MSGETPPLDASAQLPRPAPPPPQRADGGLPSEAEQGKVLALVSYASMFTGLPLFLLPLIQADNGFSLYHAKQAAVAYVFGFVVFVGATIVALFTCGIGSVFYIFGLIPLATALHGCLLALNGEQKEPFGVFGLGDKLLSGIRKKG